jgi:Zn-dependent protease with chaperone function
MYESLAICLSLSGLLAINSMGSLLAAAIWRLTSRAAEAWPISVRAQFLFLLRVAPPVVAVLCVGALFVPAYLANEPRHTNEIVTAKLGLMAAASLYAIGTALWRGVATCRITRRLTRDWLRDAQPVRTKASTLPVFRIRHPFPLIAIVGTLRPRLFIADQIFSHLTPQELSAAIVHEEGHWIAGDNLKRWLLRACRDSLIFKPLGRTLDRAWMESTELAADEYAARKGAPVALELASALVKVARLVPRDEKPAVFAGAYLITQEIGTIQRRVLRLTQLAERLDDLKSPARISDLKLAVGISGLFLTLILIASSSGLLATIHSALECVVSVLQ